MSRYIKADELKKVFSDGYEAFAKTLCEIVDEQPTADVVERKHGEWIYKPMKGQFCSVCDVQSVWKYNYCPNCGAEMKEVEDDKGRSN